MLYEVITVAAALARLGTPGRRAVGAAGLVVALVAGGAAWSLARAPETEGTRFATESPYARIEVRDRHDVRHLLIDGGVHTAVRLDNGSPVHVITSYSIHYTKLYEQ